MALDYSSMDHQELRSVQRELWRKMNVRQREFVRLTLAHPEMTGLERYARAGYDDTNKSSAYVRASQLLKSPRIAPYLATIAELETRSHTITKDSVIEDLDNLYALAVEKGDYVAARACKADIAKLLDYYPAQKTESTVTLEGEMAVTEDEIDRLLLAGMGRKYDSTVQH